MEKGKTGYKVCEVGGENYNQLNCCGIGELIFLNLEGAYKNYKDDPDWDCIVALYIKHSLGHLQDHRMMVVGIPVEVGINSQYNIKFYEKVRKSLEAFGFCQLGASYKNQNSKNTIVAYAGQMP